MKKITFLVCLMSYMGFSQTFGVSTYATGFNDITDIVNAGDSRLFVVQKAGAIKIIKPVGSVGVVNGANFLTLPTSMIDYNGIEGGLLGLAFHPNFASNHYFYVNYTRSGDGASVIARYTANNTNPDLAIPTSAVILLTVTQSGGVHNGGTLRFGPDGYLYTGIGDGAVYTNPLSLSQDVNSNRGKLLRIDVNSGSPYGIPATNPFLGVAGNDEIWALGLRNPWKFSFNRLNGDLWIADVGEGTEEEVNKISSPLPNTGLNFGWRCYEGNSPSVTAGCADLSAYTFPIATYTTGSFDGCAVIGGYYYTGSQYPDFAGKYIFGDVCAGKILSLTSDGTLTASADISGLYYLTTFGEDINGELFAGASGTVYRLIDTSLGINSFAENGLSMYPNPANPEVSIRNTSDKILTHFRLFDIAGKLILQQEMDNIETNTINTSALESGLYIVTVEDISGARFTSKLTID